MSNNPDIQKIINGLAEQLEAPLRDRLIREVDSRIEQYRRAVWVREDWCCNDMSSFAVETWNAPNPKADRASFGHVSYQLRGRHVNYCPFCGVAIGNAPLTHVKAWRAPA